MHPVVESCGGDGQMIIYGMQPKRGLQPLWHLCHGPSLSQCMVDLVVGLDLYGRGEY